MTAAKVNTKLDNTDIRADGVTGILKFSSITYNSTRITLHYNSFREFSELIESNLKVVLGETESRLKSQCHSISAV
jgi:hypothetical protein